MLILAAWCGAEEAVYQSVLLSDDLAISAADVVSSDAVVKAKMWQ